jgi:uncharacterized membrane protein
MKVLSKDKEMDFIINNFYDGKINSETLYKIISIVTFLVLTIDFIWIKLVMLDQYNSLIYNVQNKSLSVRFIPTILSYITIILPIVLFVIPKLTQRRRVLDSLVYGGIMGFLMYGMFSFTNYALIQDWSFTVVLLDTIWGAILYSIVSLLTSYLLF